MENGAMLVCRPWICPKATSQPSPNSFIASPLLEVVRAGRPRDHLLFSILSWATPRPVRPTSTQSAAVVTRLRETSRALHREFPVRRVLRISGSPAEATGGRAGGGGAGGAVNPGGRPL